MSDNIPIEIQAEIMKRLPVKSLLQLRSVCKAWKTLIDGSDFINHYTGQTQHLLLWYEDKPDFEEQYVLFADDHTFPDQNVFPSIHPLVKMFERCKIIDSCHGLLCLYGDYKKDSNGPVCGTGRAVIWNPSVRKAVDVVVPNVADGWLFETVVGFGVCRETTDPKIVKINYIYIDWKAGKEIKSTSFIPCQVEVFCLSAGVWRAPYSGDLPRKSIHFAEYSNQVVIDGVVYWFSMDKVTMDGGFQSYNLIISFDMTSEEFREINLPDSLARLSFYIGPICKLRESLVVLENSYEANNLCFAVWMMEDGVSKTFTKLFTINLPDVDVTEACVRGFRKTGEAIIDSVSRYPEWSGSLAVYEPYSKSIRSLGINGSNSSSLMYSYIETLLLL